AYTRVRRSTAGGMTGWPWGGGCVRNLGFGEGEAGATRAVPGSDRGRFDLLGSRRAGLRAVRRAPGQLRPRPILLLRGVSRRGGVPGAHPDAAPGAMASGGRRVPGGAVGGD